jgi:hypothetical protein
MVNHSHEFAEWMQSWATRLQNVYNAGIDQDGYPHFLEALKYYDATGKFTPGQLDYLLRRDSHLGHGKLKDYNTYKGLNKRMGNFLPAPVQAIIHSNFIDWSVKYQNLPDLIKRLTAAAPGWEFNSTSYCWQGKSLETLSNITDIFN